jgi:hypothetical protein
MLYQVGRDGPCVRKCAPEVEYGEDRSEQDSLEPLLDHKWMVAVHGLVQPFWFVRWHFPEWDNVERANKHHCEEDARDACQPRRDDRGERQHLWVLGEDGL